MALRKKRLQQQTEAAEAGGDSNNFEKMVKSGPQGAYEALQLYRSKAIRFKSKNDIHGATNLLAGGCVLLLVNKYENAGSELGSVFIDHLTDSKIDIGSADLRQQLYQIDSSFDPESVKRVDFLKACLKWTMNSGSRELGDPEIQVRLADCTWKNDIKGAIHHYTAGEAPKPLLEKIYSSYLAGASGQSNIDKAIASGIVNFLALENLRDANILYKTYTKTHKKLSPLLHFCGYLLQTCRTDGEPLFKLLLSKYHKEVASLDEGIISLLKGPVAMKFFGIQPEVNPMMAMLQNMMK